MAKKRKRLDITPADRLVGIQAHNKQDLLAGCNEPGRPWYNQDANQFTKAYCRVCRNHDCIRARGARTPWHDRMERQVEYLINNPQFSDMEKAEHRAIAETVWESMRHKAERLEIAAKRQDWEVPEMPTDGVPKLSDPETSKSVDDAVKALSRARGKTVEEEEEEPEGEAPPHFQPEGDGSEVVYETQYPSSSGKGHYRVWLQEDGLWQCECDGYKYRQKCKHLLEVVPWYNQNIRDRVDEDEEKESPPPQPATQAPPQQPPAPRGPIPTSDPRVKTPPPMNTPMPQEGVMIGGGPAPPESSKPEHDPWAVPKDKVVEPGARVVVKSGKK